MEIFIVSVVVSTSPVFDDGDWFGLSTLTPPFTVVVVAPAAPGFEAPTFPDLAVLAVEPPAASCSAASFSAPSPLASSALLLPPQPATSTPTAANAPSTRYTLDGFRTTRFTSAPLSSSSPSVCRIMLIRKNYEHQPPSCHGSELFPLDDL